MGKHSHTRRPLPRRSFLLGVCGLGASVVAGSFAGSNAFRNRLPRASESTSPDITPAALPQLTLTEAVALKYAHAIPQGWGLNMPGITTTVGAQRTVALTFDACGGSKGSLIDAPLIATLIDHQVPATLFLNQRWIEANLQKAKELAENPLFQIENHGTAHRPLSVNGRTAYGIAGTASVEEAIAEIEGNRSFMRSMLGVESRWFRSGTAHYDDVCVALAHDLGLGIAGFDINGDSGATAPSGAVQQQLSTARAGSVVLMHMNQPNSGTAAGVRSAIPKLRAAGFSFVHMGSPA